MEKEVLEMLGRCTVDGNNVKLNEAQLDRKLYEQVAKSLNGIGGKWKGGKVSAFVFEFDPTERLAQIQGGEKVNLKKQYQFFETPDDVAAVMVEFLEAQPGDIILEPSAGRGALIRALNPAFNNLDVHAVELMPENYEALQNPELGINLTYNEDFLSFAADESVHRHYDRVIANPPFANNQDIDHVLAMYQCLKPGGKLVSIMSVHWQFANFSKEIAFREFIRNVNAHVQRVWDGAFKESGTNVNTVFVVIDKPEE